MRLKSFYGPTMTEAMRMVREALGEDAIIVATRDDENGGVRVTAAIDDPLTSTTPVMVEKDTGCASLDKIAQAFLAHKVPATLAEKLLATATQYANEDPFLSLGAAFDVHFKYAPLPDAQTAKPILLVGPPGAGKTLCAAKLATQATLAGRKIALISTDTERAGGMAQLGAFARVLKTEMLEIEDPHALEGAVSIQSPDTLTLIDTAGCNPFVAEDRAALTALIKSARAQIVLVLPADMQADQAVDLAKEFTALGATSLIVTRLDITRRFGDMLHYTYESRLPLAALCASSKVTQAPAACNPVTMARLILPLQSAPESKRA